VAVAAVTGQGVKGVVEAVAPVVVQSFTPAEAGEDFAWNPEMGVDGGSGPGPAWPARPEAAAGNGGPSLLPIVGVGVGIYLLMKGG
jgi:hypothetical protein